MTADWRHRYNHHLSHGALGSVLPVKYRVTNFPTPYFCVAQKLEAALNPLKNIQFLLWRPTDELLVKCLLSGTEL